MGPQGVDIDPGAGNSLDKHKPEAAGSIGLQLGVGSIQVVLGVRRILRVVDRGRVVGQAHRLGAGRALDPDELDQNQSGLNRSVDYALVQPVLEGLRPYGHRSVTLHV